MQRLERAYVKFTAAQNARDVVGELPLFVLSGVMAAFRNAERVAAPFLWRRLVFLDKSMVLLLGVVMADAADLNHSLG